ncbi:hypothetical protein QZH41_002057 [Actinostola sp. cb2023]|nr:hypothetical protein QZH41_002057 [Actinostola sp. cb2023]
MKQMESSVRKVDGHYEVGILWKNTEPWLPENRQMAEARLQSLKRKLERNEHLHRKYRDFMNNLVAKGYARKLTAEEAGPDKNWYGSIRINNRNWDELLRDENSEKFKTLKAEFKKMMDIAYECELYVISNKVLRFE